MPPLHGTRAHSISSLDLHSGSRARAEQHVNK